MNLLKGLKSQVFVGHDSTEFVELSTKNEHGQQKSTQKQVLINVNPLVWIMSNTFGMLNQQNKQL